MLSAAGQRACAYEALWGFACWRLVAALGKTSETSVGQHYAAIVSTVAAGVSAAVLVLGGYYGRRYLVRATPNVVATLSIWRGEVVIHVQPSIQSNGLKKLKLAGSKNRTPAVTVTEMTKISDEVKLAKPIEQRPFEDDEEVAPGELVSDSLVFLFPPPNHLVFGWAIEFSFAVLKRFHSGREDSHYVYWTAKTFITAPSPDGTRGTVGPRG